MDSSNNKYYRGKDRSHGELEKKESARGGKREGEET